MEKRYVIFDEIELEVFKDETGTVVFATEEEAFETAERVFDSFQIIEIPFYEEKDEVI